MITKLVELSDHRFRNSKCWLCSYRKHCPHNCGECLHYIHTPSIAPAPRKYDCGRMCDYYVCKYSHKYMSELWYAFRRLIDIQHTEKLKVLSIGCGPCTDILALDALRQDGIYEFNHLDYKGIEIDPRIWKKVHENLKQIAPANYSIEIIPEDACEYVDQLLEQDWHPNIIVFQYVFSDMQKHSDISKVNHLISAMGEYISKCNKNTYIVCNDINLSKRFNGGRELFDELLAHIKESTNYRRCHFKNNNKNGHFEYGDEYRKNELVRNIPANLMEYNPYNSCSSAQLIIKRV